jgi:hypothetical protein
VPKKLDQQAYQAMISAQVRDGETSSQPFAAITPDPDEGRGFGLIVAFPVLWAMRRLSKRHARRDTTKRSGIRMAQRMLVAVTSDRMLIWSAQRHWAPGEFLGDVALNRIADAQAPTVGQGWRSVRIDLVDGESVTIKVGSQHADELAGLLSRAG